MQNAELYRKGVVLPATPDAAKQLRDGTATVSTPVEHLEMTDDDQFTVLVIHGAFRQINEACDTLIDEYEEDWIPHSRMKDLKAAVAGLLKNPIWSPKNLEFLERLSQLAEKAERTRQDILFVC